MWSQKCCLYQNDAQLNFIIIKSLKWTLLKYLCNSVNMCGIVAGNVNVDDCAHTGGLIERLKCECVTNLMQTITERIAMHI